MRLSKVFAAVAAAAAMGSAFAGNVDDVSASPIPILLATKVGGGVVAGLEYIVTTDDPAGTFAAFCLDPALSYFGNTPGGPVPYSKATISAAQANALSILFTGANHKSWDHLNDGVMLPFQQHGLAMAVWDIMIDDGNLSTGAFAISNDGAGGTALAFVANAQAMGNVSLAGNLIKLDLTNPKFQDLVIAVPEPSTYAMLLAGLAGVGFVARRRQQRG